LDGNEMENKDLITEKAAEGSFVLQNQKPGKIVNGKFVQINVNALSAADRKKLDDDLRRYAAERERKFGKGQLQKDIKTSEKVAAEQEARRKAEADKKKPSVPPAAQPPDGQPAPQPTPPRQPAPPAAPAQRPPQTSPVAKYMAAAAAARKSGDPAQMAQVRDMGLEIWRKSNPKLAAAAAERERIRGTAQTDNPLMKDMRDRLPLTPSVQSPTFAKDLGSGGGNQSLLNNPNASISATPKPTIQPVEKSQFSNKATPEMNQSAKNLSDKPLKKPEVKKEAYDIVLDYLFSEGHVDTISEAHYVMMQMDAEHIQSIVLEQPQMSPIFQNPASKYKYGLEARTAAAANFFKRGIKPEPKLPSLVYNTDGGPVNRSPLAKSKPAAVFKFGDPKTDEFAAARQFTQPAKPFRRGDPETDEFAAARKYTKPVVNIPANTSVAKPPKVAAPVTSEKPATPAATSTPAAPEPRLTKAQQDILDLRQMRAGSLSRQGDVAAAQKLQTQVDVARAEKKMPPKEK